MDLKARNLRDDSVGVSEEAARELGRALRGDVILPTDTAYDEARTIWNAMIDRRPAFIVRCQGASDVVRAMRFVRENDLLFSIRGAGHNIAGKALVDGGVLIDLSAMTSVHVDPAGRTVRAEPGATLGDLDHETQLFGLAVPVGINSTTGVAGLTLGGGFGWLSRRLGMTIDSLLSVDMVTADGDLIRASASEHPDLFWALRGGGGNFGIVTSFEYRCHPIGPDLYCGLIVHAFADARSVLQRHVELCATASDDLTVWAVLRKAPPLPFLPETWHGKEVLVLALVYAGDATDGEKATAAVRSLGSPVGQFVGPMPFTAFQASFDPLLTPGARNYWKSHNFDEVGPDAMDVIVDFAGRLPSDESEIFLAQMGGATSHVAKDATAYLHRDANFILNVHTRWTDPADDQRCIDWARSFFDAAAEHATGGVYINFMPEDEVARVEETHGSNFARLQEVKAKYDPANLFRVNQNIRPS